jgi:NADH:ubiquinone oxidoreductase subunit 3 (subunit A)
MNDFVVQHGFLSQLLFLVVPLYIQYLSKWSFKLKMLGIVGYVGVLLVTALCWG